MSVRIAVVTPAQADVIAELACDGPTNRQIGERLGITEDTVKRHIRDALSRTGYDNRTALAVALLRGQLRLRTTDNRDWRAGDAA